MTSCVVVTRDAGVMTVRLNRPDVKNSFNDHMYRGVLAALRSAAADDEVLVVLLTGTGDYFRCVS
jgi:enoyl-CoA hydratase/carnithine racemase